MSNKPTAVHKLLLSATLLLLPTLRAHADAPDSAAVQVRSTFWASFTEQMGAFVDAKTLANRLFTAPILQLAWQPTSDYLYARLYRRPKFGLGLELNNFHNPQVGHPCSLFGWFEAPLLPPRAGRPLIFGYGVEMGMAYGFNPYDEEHNPENILISTRWNVRVALYAYAEYAATPRLHVAMHAGFKHFSNGARHKPNFGINLLTLGLSTKYRFDWPMFRPKYLRLPVPQPDTAIALCKRWRAEVHASAGYKQNNIGTPVYWKTLLGVRALRPMSHKLSLGAGLEGIFAFGKRDDGAQRSTWREVVSLATVASAEWNIWADLAIPIAVGTYLTPPKLSNDERSRMYERIGLKKYLLPQVWASVTIRAHGVKADAFEYGVGYVF